MSSTTTLDGTTSDGTTRLHQDLMRSMYASVDPASIAGLSTPGGAELPENGSVELPSSMDDVHTLMETIDSMHVDSSAESIGSPAASTPASSYSADCSDNDNDEDAMVDAAENESGLFANALLAEEHIVLDTALLREMDELLNRADLSQWNQFHLESPSLTFPSPGAPWAMAHGAVESVPIAPTSVPQAAPLLSIPPGGGWQGLPTTQQSPGDSDMEMEDAEAVVTSSEPGDTKEMELLARQIKFLEAQREFLEYKATLASASEDAMATAELINRRNAIQEKRRLVEAQLHQEMLTKVAKQQLENLKYMELMLLQSPLNHYRNTLMVPMESYIHLTRDKRERRQTLLTLRDEKIEATRRFIEFQSRNIDLERQFFYLDTFEKFGKFYTVDFSISKFNDVTVDDVVHVIYNHFVSTKDMISQILGSVENREYFDGIDETFLNARFVDRINLPKRRHHDRGFVVQESNTVYYVKRFDDKVVMMSDCIDRDDLHPYRTRGRVRKDTTVGVIVEPFVDSIGKHSVLLKRFSFVRHHFKNIEPTPDLIQAISTKVILWGQAVRFCLSNRARATATMNSQVSAQASDAVSDSE